MRAAEGSYFSFTGMAKRCVRKKDNTEPFRVLETKFEESAAS
jgi:hypothetical protein